MDSTLTIGVAGAGSQVFVENALLPLLVAEFLSRIEVTAPSTVSQQAVGTSVSFVVRVVGLGTRGTAIDPVETITLRPVVPPGVILDYSPVLNFIGGVATQRVTVRPQAGTDATLVFAVEGQPPEVLTDTFSVLVNAVPALDQLTLVADSNLYIVRSGVEQVAVGLEMRLVYRGANRPDNMRVMLHTRASDRGLLAQLDQVLQFGGNDVIRTTVTVSLGEARSTTFSFSVSLVDSSVSQQLPTVRLELVPIFAAFSVLTPQQVQQGGSGDDFDLVVEIEALGSDGQLFALNTELSLMAAAGDNSSVDQSSYRLTFVAGRAVATVTVSLANQGIDGSISLSVASGDIRGEAAIELLAEPLLVSFQLSAATDTLAQLSADLPVQTTLQLTVTASNARLFPYSGVLLNIDAGSSPQPRTVVLQPAIPVFPVPDSGLVSTAEVVLRVLPAIDQDSELRVTAAVPEQPLTASQSVTVSVSAVPAVLAAVTLATDSLQLNQLFSGLPVMTTITVTARDNYGRLTEAGLVQFETTATNGAAVAISSVTVGVSGRAMVPVTIVLSDVLDSTVNLSIARRGFDESVEFIPASGLSLEVLAAPKLESLRFELLSNAAQLI